MANSISGSVIAVSPVQTVAASDPSKQPLKKRMVYLDCTRYDPYTGERSQYENKTLLEFGGDKLVEKLGALDLKEGDVVKVSFFIQGTPYKDQQGKTKVFTGIRTTDIEVVRKKDAPAPTPAPAEPAAKAGSSVDGRDGLPFL